MARAVDVGDWGEGRRLRVHHESSGFRSLVWGVPVINVPVETRNARDGGTTPTWHTASAPRYLSLSRSHTHSLTRSLSLTHTKHICCRARREDLERVDGWSVGRAQGWGEVYLSFSLTRTLTHTHRHSLSFTYTHSLTHSLTHTHTHAHTHFRGFVTCLWDGRRCGATVRNMKASGSVGFSTGTACG